MSMCACAWVLVRRDAGCLWPLLPTIFFVCVCECVCLCGTVYVHVCVCEWLCVSVYVSVSVCVFVWMCIVYMSVSVYEFLFDCVWVCVSVCMKEWVSVCVHVGTGSQRRNCWHQLRSPHPMLVPKTELRLLDFAASDLTHWIVIHWPLLSLIGNRSLPEPGTCSLG